MTDAPEILDGIDADSDADEVAAPPANPPDDVPPDNAEEAEPPEETSASGPPETDKPQATRNDAGRDNVTSHRGDAWVENITNNYFRSMSALTRYATDHAAVDRDMRNVVSPPDAEEHLSALGENRILVLTGAAHTGLSTAAVYRWHQFRNSADGLTLEELHPDTREGLQEAIDESAADTVQLLDASGDPEISQDIVELLPRFRAALRARDSYLVIALGEQFHAPAVRSLPGSVFAIGRPDPRRVLAAYLDVDAEPLLANERFNAILAKCWPPRAEKLAAILNEADGDVDVDAFLDVIEQRLEDWTDRLEGIVKELEPDARALLVSAAAMEGAPAGSIALAADWFMDAVEYEGPHKDMLSMQALGQRFVPLVEVYRTEENSSKFTEDGYGEAILPVIWSQFPTWREPMRGWFDRLLRPSSYLDDDQTATLLLRLLELASDTGDAPLLLERAANLLSGGGSKQRQELATNLLVAAATDPTIGRRTRYQLLQWARNRERISVAMQLTVLAACTSSEYRRRFPDSAMRRLKHLAKSGDRGVRSRALGAMVDIGSSMSMRSMMLHLSEWAASGRGDRLRGSVPWLAGRLFTSDSVLARLRDRPWELNDAQEFAMRFWKRLFATATPNGVRAVVAAWLAMASELAVPYREWAADLLSTTAADDIRAIGQLAQAVSLSAVASLPNLDRIQPMLARIRAGLNRMEIPLS